MTTRNRLGLLTLALGATALFAPSLASARTYYSGGYGLGYGWGGTRYGVYDSDRVPYFALHPPVRYSEEVPRTFGYSPFAYPPGVMTPEAPTPQTVINSNVPGAASVAPSEPSGPLVIINPYVTQKK